MEFYEIQIKGHLDTRRAAWFEGLTLTQLPNGATRLAGAITDQAALYGILTRIRDLGLPLLLVERKEEKEGHHEQSITDRHPAV